MNSFYGSIGGNLLGTLYFLFFQIAGIILTQYLLRNKDFVTRLLCGSVLGSVMLQWLPALFAFIFGFSFTAHMLAGILCVITIALLIAFRIPHASVPLLFSQEWKSLMKKHLPFIVLCAVTFLIFCIMLSGHTLLLKDDGFHTGQCTFGDMNMHLGFITSIAKQKTFPPFYSISPGSKLCYPFLCDSISSSIYLFGASLRYAYMLPMYFAVMQVFLGFYCIAYSWLKRAGKACLAWFFFFYNGGLGFVYFLDWSNNRTYHFKNIFTEYYQTPTNLISNNIRWVNIMVDMLLPQRATLFGYAVLFTCIWLLFRAVFLKEKDLFPFVAVLTGTLPMIHTHSFLAMALISAAWLLMSLWQAVYRKSKLKYPGKLVFPGFFILMISFQIINRKFSDGSVFLTIRIVSLSLLFLIGLYCLMQYIRLNGLKNIAATWGVYLFVILFLALPQLFAFTFAQASGSGFNTGHFNWGNLGDNYLWFYIKNWGIILFLLVPAILYSSRKNFRIIFAGLLIWFVVELVAFSPNTYDNNKLLYVAYIFFCCISADYGYELYQRVKTINGMRLLSFVFLFLSCFSAILSLMREVVSDYRIYSNDQIDVAMYIEENTPARATFLTSERHLNEAAVLTGRNIVSGAWIYLGPHGIYDDARAQDVRAMFESPETSLALFQKYSVDYVIISSYERNDYQIDETLFDTLFPCVYEKGDIKVYQAYYPQQIKRSNHS